MNASMKHYLPGMLDRIRDVASEEAAIALAKARGGRDVYIPASPNPRHALSQIVGLSAAKKISKALGRGNILVPCGSVKGAGGRKAAIEHLFQAGKSNAEIAAEVDVHIRTVERVVSGLKDPRQSELPL